MEGNGRKKRGKKNSEKGKLRPGEECKERKMKAGERKHDNCERKI